MTIELTSLVEQGIATLAPYAAQGAAIASGKLAIEQAYQWLQSKLQHHEIWKRWKEQPSNDRRGRMLLDLLMEMAEEDPAFAQELKSCFHPLVSGTEVKQQVNQHGEKSINIGYANRIDHIGDNYHLGSR